MYKYNKYHNERKYKANPDNDYHVIYQNMVDRWFYFIMILSSIGFVIFNYSVLEVGLFLVGLICGGFVSVLLIACLVGATQFFYTWLSGR